MEVPDPAYRAANHRTFIPPEMSIGIVDARECAMAESVNSNINSKNMEIK